MAQTPEQKQAFEQALKIGKLTEVARNNGDCGYLRKDLTEKERVKRKKARKQARLSRKINRKGA